MLPHINFIHLEYITNIFFSNLSHIPCHTFNTEECGGIIVNPDKEILMSNRKIQLKWFLLAFI